MLRAPCFARGSFLCPVFLRGVLLDAHDFEFVACDLELDFAIGERKAVNALGIVLVGGTGVLLQYLDKRCTFLGREFVQYVGFLDVDFVAENGVGKAANGFRMRIGVGEVRLDIDDGRSVQQVCAADNDFWPLCTVDVNLFNLDARERNRVGPKAGTCREDAESLVAAESWRTDGRAPGLANVLRKNPYDPQMAESFEAAERFCIAELRFEADN